jgi:hypothetical protein
MSEGGAARELLAIFDVKLDEKGMEEADKGIAELGKKLKEFGEIAIAAFAVEKIGEFVKSTIEMGEEIANTAKRLDVGTDELQKFRGALELSGGSAENADTALKFLSKNIGQAKNGSKELATEFQRLGVDLNEAEGQARPLLDVTADLADALSSIEDPAKRADLQMKLMGRGGMVLNEAFSHGAAGLEDLYKEVEEAGGVLSEDFVSGAKKAGDELKKWDMSIRALKVSLVNDFLPQIREIIEKARHFVTVLADVVKHTHIVKEALALLATAGILKVVFALKDLLGLAKGEGLIESVIGGAEVALIAIALLGIALAIDDIYTAVNGGDSETGDLLNKALGADNAAVLLDQIKGIWDSLSIAFSDSVGTSIDWSDILYAALATIISIGVVFADILKTVLAIGDVIAGIGHTGGFLYSQIIGDEKGANKSDHAANKSFGAAGDTFASIPGDLGIIANLGGRKISPEQQATYQARQAAAQTTISHNDQYNVTQVLPTGAENWTKKQMSDFNSKFFSAVSSGQTEQEAQNSAYEAVTSQGAGDK